MHGWVVSQSGVLVNLAYADSVHVSVGDKPAVVARMHGAMPHDGFDVVLMAGTAEECAAGFEQLVGEHPDLRKAKPAHPAEHPKHKK